MPDDSTPEPMSPGGFLRFYLRGGYVIPVLISPFAGLFTEAEPVGIALIGAGVLVVTLGLALASYRRHHAARHYEAPTLQAAGELPASALTPPDRLERRRGLAIVWWALVLGSGAAVVWGFAVLIGAGGFSVSSTLLPYELLAVVIAVGWFMVAAQFVWMRPVLARNARLAARHPDALVLTGYQGSSDGISSGGVLDQVTDAGRAWWRVGLPRIFTLLVDADGIGFWRGGLRPRRQYHVPWRLVARCAPSFVTTGDSRSTGPRPGVELSLREYDGDEFLGLHLVEFRPARANLWVGNPYGSREVVEAVAAAIDARHPEGDRRFRGYTVDELRKVIAELESGGEDEMVAETLAEARAWIAARGGAVPPGGDWLLERLAVDNLGT
ncbi:hypothetical protein [Agromyces sp. SYSU T00194]|uniref:hypothetical protein n=1 Tax=Agromyces chitinivorans TaxID=3158560 RepID=UPI00339A82FF